MTYRKSHSRVLSCLFAFTLAVAVTASASHEKILRAFTTNPVEFPSSGLISDPSGNLFGVLQGAVYELSPSASGGYTFHVISTLIDVGTYAAGNLVRDDAGNLFGSTRGGGLNGCGYIFELSPPASGLWTLTTLHDFDCTDGQTAGMTMARDVNGNLFGATQVGGTLDQGVVYELSPGPGGTWTYQVLHNFAYFAEGGSPEAGVVLDSNGNLYGPNNNGIYKLTPGAGGTWTESAAYTFNSATDGDNPHGDLIFDSSGNLYGTNTTGGLYGNGTVFELSPASGGGWTVTVLYNFFGSDGALPAGGVIRDGAGNLYGTTQFGGAPNNAGTVFKLALVGGVWQKIILYRFGGVANSDGSIPNSSLYLNSKKLFGTTPVGGNAGCNSGAGCGTVFVIH